VKLDGNLDADI
jgi:serine/threonine protein kinase